MRGTGTKSQSEVTQKVPDRHHERTGRREPGGHPADVGLGGIEDH